MHVVNIDWYDKFAQITGVILLDIGVATYSNERKTNGHDTN